MSFTGLHLNAPMDAAAFHFKPPSGADLIQQ
jgi:outer membrane lipoprotein-sorting protein